MKSLALSILALPTPRRYSWVERALARRAGFRRRRITFLGTSFNTDRHCEPEGRAFPDARFNPHAAAVQFDDPLGNRQPEACATLRPGAGTVDLTEFLEDVLLIL